MMRLGVVLLAVLSSSCSVLYLFNSSEENLPCGPADVNGTPRCLDGFVCIEATDGIERCVKAGFKEEGDSCIDSGECKDGGVCADVYSERCDGDVVLPEHELDCALRDQGDKGLRCRKPCNDQLLCGADQRCFDVEGLPPFCEQGTCTTDNDCVAGINQGICIQEALNGGRSGLCRKVCDPIDCFDNNAAGCTCAADENCATPPDESGGFATTRAVCLPAGVIGPNLTCDEANFCAAGSTCVLSAGAVQCKQWCRSAGQGAPQCDTGSCADVAGNSGTGICQ